MKYSILVIPKPHRCEECMLYDDGFGMCGERFKRVDPTMIPKWCKLRDAPIKEERWYETDDFTRGWNACVREIENG